MLALKLNLEKVFTSTLMMGSFFFVSAEEKKLDDLMSLSLDELLKVQMIIPAAITKGEAYEAPAAFTSITQRDIEVTPARNILDLIEIYVPGATWLNYEEGPLIGMRGNIVNGNYKYLLLLNGRVLNTKAMRGAQSELEQWNLTDIDRIEVFRTPGSVTFGPGAVAGVIHIHTKKAKSKNSLDLNGHYISKYNSKGFSLNHSLKRSRYKAFTHFSTTQTRGYQAQHFLGDKGAGYIGKDILLGDQPLDYFADSEGTPQIKFHTDVTFQKGWSAWLRYTQQGSTWTGNEVKTDFGDGNFRNAQSTEARQLTLTVEHLHHFSKNSYLDTMFSIDSYDSQRRLGKAIHLEYDHPQNKKTDFGEDEILLNSTYHISPNDWSDMAFGFEYSYEHFGKGWGDDIDDMRLGGDGQIVSGDSSNAIGPKLDPTEAIYVGNGWDTHSFAIFSEANFKVREKYKFLVSSRLDKSSFSNYLFSPRIAAHIKLDPKNSLRLIAQRSLRRNTSSHEFIEHQTGQDASTEDLDSFETIFTRKLSQTSFLNVGTFFNDAEVIAWHSDRELTLLIGNLKTYGLELEYDQRTDEVHYGLNYSFTKQLDYDLEPGINSSGISYSDYSEEVGNEGAVIRGKGNDLNNWPNQALKLFVTKPIGKKWSFHINTQAFWDYQGGKDGLAALEQAVQGTSDEAAAEAAIQKVKDENTFGLNFRTNLSLVFRPNEKGKLSFNVYNLFGDKHNKRYSYDNGTSKPGPHKVRFIREERAFGFQFDYKW